MNTINFKILYLFCITIFFSACGSGPSAEKTRSSSQQQSSSTTSSIYNSSSSENYSEIQAEYIFPTFKSNLGGVKETAIKLKIYNSEPNRIISAVEINNSIQLQENENGIWESHSELLQLITGEQQITIDVIDTLGNRIDVGSLILFNDQFGNAGESDDEAVNATGLAFNRAKKELFVSNAYQGKVYLHDFSNSKRKIIFKNDIDQNSFEPLFWQMVIDNEHDSLFVFSDEFSFDETTGAEINSVKLIEIKLSTENSRVINLQSSNELNKIKTARSIFIDETASLPTNIESFAGEPSLYVLDYKNTPTLKRATIDNRISVGLNPIYVDDQSNIASKFEPLSMLRIGDSILVAKKYVDSFNISKPSLTEISFSRVDSDFDDIPDSTNIVAKYYADLQSGNYAIQKPSAMALNHEKTILYIADQDRIWQMDITKPEKPITLLTSSNIIPQKLGDGPRLGSSITTMQMHPEYEVLYVAAGTQGIIAIDSETGNRITVAK